MDDPSGTGTALIAHPGAELYGSDRMALEAVAGLVERGWRVVVAVPCDGPLVEEAQRLGAETLVVEFPVLRKSLLSPLGLAGLAVDAMTAARRIDAVLRSVRPQVLYVSTMTIPLWIARGRARRVPVVCHVHESERGAARLLRRALAQPLLRCDRVLVNSGFSRDTLLEAAPSLAGRSTVVLNGVAAPATRGPARVSLDGPLRLVYVGRFSPRKGVDVAVDALADLRDSGLDAELELVGGVFPGYEWYLDELRERVATAGLTDRVRITGFRPEVWTALRRADVALVPSREAEPFGNTAVEAVLAGRPVVLSAIGGLPEATDGFACAVPVPADDPAALADAVRRIAGDWPRFRSLAAADADAAARRYDPEHYRAAVAGEMTRLLPRGTAHRTPIGAGR